jgi:DNA-binding IclR family transcriptional regulator
MSSIRSMEGIVVPAAEHGTKRSMLSRALAILCQFEPTDRALTLTELSRRAHLSKPTASRLVTELVQWGLLERSGRQLRLGQRLSVLGSRVPRHRVLRDAATPVLMRLHELTGGCAYLSVRDGDSAVPLDRFGWQTPEGPVPSSWERIIASAAIRAMTAFDRPLRPLSTVEQRRPVDRQLTAVRSLGYAVVQHAEGAERVLGVACPVVLPAAGAVAAVSLVGLADRCPVGTVAPSVRGAAIAIGRALNEAADVEWVS